MSWGSGTGGPYYPPGTNYGVVDLERENRELKEKVRVQSSSTAQIAVVARVYKRGRDIWVSVMTQGYVLETLLGDEGFVDKDTRQIAIGDGIKLVPNDKGHLCFTGTIKDHFNIGRIATVSQIISHNTIEVDTQSFEGVRIVACAVDRFDSLSRGTRVVLDKTGSVVVGVTKDHTKNAFSFDADTKVSWGDIGGLQEAKDELIEAIEMPIKFPKLYARYGKKSITGILMAGPSGCGKTLLAKATATALRGVHGEHSSFFYVAGPSVVSKYIGEGEERVRSIFQAARAHEKQSGSPAVIFIDECDAFLGKREEDIHHEVERRMVPAFLSEMDGLETMKTMVLLATNRPASIDEAITRHGRIDRTVIVRRPDKKTAFDIFGIETRNTPVANSVNKDSILSAAVESIYHDDAIISDYAIQGLAQPLRLRLRDLISGAMVAGVVDKATSIALRRDREEGRTDDVCGVTGEDFESAVRFVLAEEKHKNHKSEIERILAGHA